MFQPEVTRFVPTIGVVGEGFCFPYLVDLIVKKKSGFSNTKIDVVDGNGTLLLQVKGSMWQFRKKRLMYDSISSPLLTIRQKEVAWRQRWTVHRGVGSEESNLLYTVEQSQSLQFKTQLSVFLATSLTGEICDFCVVGSYVSQSFKVYKGDTLIAEVKQRFNLGSLGKEKFEARVYPGVDYAFIVSLLVILNEIDS
ncbi:protein LURP-one-related 14-like [Olea europaea var. sylvestris]|uniref:protein LURP-one-related 14-like n=1 Tax=Olea europaea var. sylvestris TaxID=158386 RepID=UPI000C1D3989|nr:protein LURP-one-related 14-like [Olea europaea var. sylvestris]